MWWQVGGVRVFALIQVCQCMPAYPPLPAFHHTHLSLCLAVHRDGAAGMQCLSLSHHHHQPLPHFTTHTTTHVTQQMSPITTGMDYMEMEEDSRRCSGRHASDPSNQSLPSTPQGKVMPKANRHGEVCAGWDDGGAPPPTD